MKKVVISTEEIESKVAHFFGIRTHLIVPNVSWGLGIHECDLLICSKSGYCTEVEIKISKSDLIKDKEKTHGHKNEKIKYLYFAIPEKLETPDIIEHIPPDAGILVIRQIKNRYHVKKIREAVKNKNCRALTEREQYEMARLGALRIWGLKNKCTNYKKDYKAMKERITQLEEEIYNWRGKK